jgi:hypothetical protein
VDVVFVSLKSLHQLSFANVKSIDIVVSASSINGFLVLQQTETVYVWLVNVVSTEIMKLLEQIIIINNNYFEGGTEIVQARYGFLCFKIESQSYPRISPAVPMMR